MKKKIISSLLVMVLLLCAVPVAFPGVGNTGLYANAEETSTDAPNTNPPVTDPPITEDPSVEDSDALVSAKEEEPEEENWGYFSKMFVWVERSRDENLVQDDKIVMELIPVAESQQEEYLKKFQDFTGWDTEDVFLYSPADAFFTGQVDARLVEFSDHHRNSGKLTMEVSLLDAQVCQQYVAPEGAVYYEHKAFNDSTVSYGMSLRVGELRIQLPEDFGNADFTFAAKPDGSGGWDIILRDAQGNDIDYTIV